MRLSLALLNFYIGVGTAILTTWENKTKANRKISPNTGMVDLNITLAANWELADNTISTLIELNWIENVGNYSHHAWRLDTLTVKRVTGDEQFNLLQDVVFVTHCGLSMNPSVLAEAPHLGYYVHSSLNLTTLLERYDKIAINNNYLPLFY